MTAIHEKVPQFFFGVALLEHAGYRQYSREIHKARGFQGVSFIQRRRWRRSSRCSELGIFPHIVISQPEPGEQPHDRYNAASSSKTLAIMGIIALIGIPVVLAYTATIHWIFRGKVKLTRTSY